MAKKKAPPKQYNLAPPDYLSGSKEVGKKYKAWERIAGRRKPDLGKGAGPGIPYTTIERTVPKVKPPSKPPPKLITGGRPIWDSGFSRLIDARTAAIRRRMGG